MNAADLADARATLWYCLTHLLFEVTPDALEAAERLADEGAGTPGAHVVAARVAEHRGDLVAFGRHTLAALALDPSFHVALQDRAHLGVLCHGVGRVVSAPVRAHHVYWKATQHAGRPPQLDHHLALVARVLGVDRVAPGEASLAVADSPLFTALLLFECGVMQRFAERAGPLLPASERTLVEGWREVRHRPLRLEAITGRERARAVDVLTGAVSELVVRIEQRSWRQGEVALTAAVPAGDLHVVVGLPLLLPMPLSKSMRRAIDRSGEELAARVLRLVRRHAGAVAA